MVVPLLDTSISKASTSPSMPRMAGAKPGKSGPPPPGYIDFPHVAHKVHELTRHVRLVFDYLRMSKNSCVTVCP